MKVQLGGTVTDRITGFRGVVTGFCTYISGCNQALVTPKCGKDGNSPDGRWIDEQRLDVDRKAKLVVLDNGSTPGFDRAPPIR